MLKAFLMVLAVSSNPSFAKMTEKQIYAASMENDAQFIECVGNIFLAVADFQRVLIEDLKWEASNLEFKKIQTARKYFDQASLNISTALVNSDHLLKELTGEKQKKFAAQLSGFKVQIGDLDNRLKSIKSKIDAKELPKIEEIHQLISLAVAGTGFGIDVSKKNDKTK